jgi:hypothetical protein
MRIFQFHAKINAWRGKMNEQQNFEFRDINQKTHQKHQKEVLWQITVPFIIGVLVILGLMVLTTAAGIQGNGQISRWADTSLIWLILPTMLFALIFLAIFSGLLYGLVRLIRVLPVYTKKAHNFFWSLQDKATKASDLAAKPVIKAASFRASLRALFGK